MSKEAGKSALKSLRRITEQALTSKRLEAAAQRAIVKGAGKSAIQKALRSGAKKAAGSVFQSAQELVGKQGIKQP